VQPPTKESCAGERPLPKQCGEVWQLTGSCGQVHHYNTWALRGAQDKEVLARLAEAEEADVICLQETKLQDSHVAALKELVQLPGTSLPSLTCFVLQWPASAGPPSGLHPAHHTCELA
jgi:hypothetical protein